MLSSEELLTFTGCSTGTFIHIHTAGGEEVLSLSLCLFLTRRRLSHPGVGFLSPITLCWLTRRCLWIYFVLIRVSLDDDDDGDDDACDTPW